VLFQYFEFFIKKMKKKIVFVMPSLDAGGGEKSLINLLATIDYAVYDVDLILFFKSGLFLDLVPPPVTVIELLSFNRTLLGDLKYSLTTGRFRYFFDRLLFTFKNRFSKNTALVEQQNWRYVRDSFPKVTTSYAAAISFLEKSSTYFVVDCLTADCKIGWVHTTYSQSGMSAAFDAPYFEQLDAVVAVSAACQQDLQHQFPALHSKIHLIHNIVSPALLLQLASEPCTYSFPSGVPVLLTIARLSPEKGLDLALEAASILHQQQVSFVWLVIGDGDERASLTAQVKALGLEAHFVFLGLLQNPYPYLQRATVYVQPSRYEGKSMAIDEAKLMHKPIVATAFSSVADQITSGINGLVCPLDSTALATSLAQLLADVPMQVSFSTSLAGSAVGTETEIEKLYALFPKTPPKN